MSFNFDLTEERKIFLSKRGKVILSACPGSGKTTVLAYKMVNLVKEVESKHNKHAGVLCLSFTNVAAQEILEKYRVFSGFNLGRPSQVMTIDSFVNTYITLPFYRLLANKDIRPQIVEDLELDLILKNYVMRFLINRKLIYFIYPPRKFEFDVNGNFVLPFLSSFTSPQDVENLGKYVAKLKEVQLDKGIFKNNDSTFIALKIIEKFPRIKNYLTTKFPYILIDEAQDTSENQYKLIESLTESNLEDLELVGDHYQAVYEWRDANPTKFCELKVDKTWQSCDFTDCRRSNQSIIDVYSKLRNSTENKISSTSADMVQNPVQIVLFNEANLVDAAKKYEEIVSSYESNIILSRGNSLIENLKGISSDKKLPWKLDVPIKLINAKKYLDSGNIKKSVDIVRSFIPLLLDNNAPFSERKITERELKKDCEFNASLLTLIKKIPSFELSLKEWTKQGEDLINGLLKQSPNISFELKKGIWIKEYPKKIVEIFDMQNNVIKTNVSTIHGVKGKTFDSVFIILNSSSSGQSISINDYVQPTSLPNEKQRLLYVAMSRPKHLLVIGIPSSTCDVNKAKQLFGNEVQIHQIPESITISSPEIAMSQTNT
ncbi:MAG: ATP-dependent helicase [Candidatus Shapirobacteria bacterium]|nr:ATP-dependent helicase [Candidatus Shapirobacteria bacterium]